MKRTSATIRWLTSDNAQVLIGAFALVCLLAYTAVHTANLLARYIEPDGFGYAAAVGIEFSIVALSLRIGQKRKAAKVDADGKAQVRGVRKFVFVIVMALVVSALANLSEGYAAAHGGARFGVDSLRSMDFAQAVILVASTALLSVLVYALADIVGGDVRTAADAAEKAERKERRADVEAAEPVKIEAQPTLPVAPVLRLPVAEAQPFRCVCGAGFDKQQSLAAHTRHCAQAQAQKGKEATG